MTQTQIKFTNLDGHTRWSWTLGSKDMDIHELDPQEYLNQLPEVVRAVVGVEFGSKTGYKHWQCCAEFAEAPEFPTEAVAWKGFVGGKLKHWPSGKPFWNAYGYCRKGGKYYQKSNGSAASTERKSGDVQIEVCDMIRSGMSVHQVHESHPVFVMNNLDKLLKYEAWLRGDYKRCRFE